MSGNATVVNGVVNNPDLQVVSPLLRIAARGQVDLPRQRMDYRGDVSLVKSCAGQGGKLRQRSFRYRCTGPHCWAIVQTHYHLWTLNNSLNVALHAPLRNKSLGSLRKNSVTNSAKSLVAL